MNKLENKREVFSPVPLAIVGIGCLFPKADNTEAFWANIREGVDAVGDIPASHWKPNDYFDGDPATPDMTYARRGAFLEAVDFNPLEFGITPNNLEAIDTTQLLGLVVAKQALRDAGYATGKDSADGRAFNRERTSVILGVTGALEMVIGLGARLGHPIWRKALREAGVEGLIAEDVVRRIAEGYVPWQENSFPGLLGNVAAGRIANRFDLGGTNCVVDAACASSLGALHMAAMELYAGRSDMAVTGGIDTFNDIFMYMCFSKTPALSATGDSRPFSAGADGTILGEGLGIVILKRLADAQRDGDVIRAVIKGIGSSSDGKGNAVYAPSAQGQVRCLMSAYAEAGVGPETIELVEAHGTGTKVGDSVEAQALDEVYRSGKKEGTWCALGSVKSMVGHTKAAAGIAGLIKAALALEHKVLPPTIKVSQPLEVMERAALYLNTEKRPWVARKGHPRRAGVSAFGFGGSNFHCVLEETRAAKDRVDWDGSVQILPFSAATREELKKNLEGLDEGMSWNKLRAEAAVLRAAFKTNANCRLVIVAHKAKSDFGKLIRSALQMLKGQVDKKAWSLPEGIYFATGNTGKLGVLFPGQGSQYVGMLRDLACGFPQMLETLASADEAFGQTEHGWRLSDQIYPVPVFTDAARQKYEAALADTRVAQPALGAVSLGAWEVLKTFGLHADAAAGHSFGELVALCAAGRIDAPAMHKMAGARAQAMANVSAGGDAGSMLAVMAPLATIQDFIASEKLNLVIANKNAPDQAVLSGATGEIERAAKLLEARGIRQKRLGVSAAFHSPLVASAQFPFAAALKEIEFKEGTLPVFANSIAEEYPTDARQAAGLLASQIAHPVEFVRQIQKMYAAGIRTFVEAGPGGKLSGLVRAILQGKDHEAIALDASNGKRSGIFDLACALGQLAALGYEIELAKWDGTFAALPREPAGKKPVMNIPLCGANYVSPRPARASDRKLDVQPHGAASTQTRGTPKEIVGETPKAKESGGTPLLRLETKEKGMEPLQPKIQPATVMSTPPAANPAMGQALQATQQSILALQKMQEQTALLHQQYLQGQEAAQRTLHQLMEQQMMLLASACGVAIPQSQMTSVPASAPVAAPVWQAPVASPVQPVPVAAPTIPVRAPEPAPVVVAQTPVASASDNRVQTILLEVVAEKTGYPVEMLELDMNLDTDLGIDSIKRVEILSALQTRMPEAPVVKPEDLGRLQTLRQIVGFLDKVPAGALKEVKTATRVEAVPTATAGNQVQTVLLEVVAEKTGYPVEMLELDMNLDTDLGIDSIKRVEILSALQTRMPEAPVVKPEDLGRLQTLRQIVGFLEGSGKKNEAKPARAAAPGGSPGLVNATSRGLPPRSYEKDENEVLDRQILTVVPLNAEAKRPGLTLAKGAEILVTEDGAGLAAKICAALKSRQFKARVIGLDAIAGKAPIAGLVLLSPNEAGAGFVQKAFALMQRIAPRLRESGKTGGAVLASISFLDGSFGLNGHAPRAPLTGGLAGLVKTAAHEWPEVACKALDVAEAMGNGEEIAGIIAEELLLQGPAEVGISDGGRCQTTLVRKALSGEPGTATIGKNDVVVVTGGARGVTAAVSVAMAKAYGCKLLLLGRSASSAHEPAWLFGLTKEGEIKKACAARMNGSGTPKALEEEYKRIMAEREVRATLAEIEATGAKVLYKSLDVRDVAAVTLALSEARKTLGPIRGIIHAAGVLQDRLIEDKTAEQFEAVYSTKVDGFHALLQATRDDDLKVIVAFSSTTGRFGRKGQVAYAAANEVLNKMAQQESHRRPGCRVLSMNWGPWEGGMVTPALRRVFENEGVALIPLQAGAEYLVREMATPAGGPVEILILGPESKATPAGNGCVEVKPAAPMTMAFERVVDVETHPVLRSHVMKGKAVLPAALMVEWLAHGAMHENPGLAFHGFEDFRILKGVVLREKESRSLQVLAGPPVSREGVEIVPVELKSGQTLHAKASILLTAKLPMGRALGGVTADQNYSGHVYQDGRLFHGPAQQGIKRVEGWSEEGIICESAAAPPPASWMEQPLRSGWLADPLALDVAFQMMILWSFEARGVGSLPTGVVRYRQFMRSFPASGVRIEARVTGATAHAATATIEFLDAGGSLVARMEGYECVLDATLEKSFAHNELEQAT